MIEKDRHINENRKFRALGFKYLIIFNFFFYFLVYLDGVYGIFQGGCRTKIYDDCDKNHYKIFGTDGIFSSINEDIIISISYLFGFDVNLNSETVIFAGWIHLFFGAMLCFDAYVQNLEEYFLELNKINRREYRHLVRENIMLKPKIEQRKNILANINAQVNAIVQGGLIEEEKEEKEEKEGKDEIRKLRKKLTKIGTIKFDFNAQDEIQFGKDLISKFSAVFKNARKMLEEQKNNEKKIKLSSTNNKMKIMIIIKKLLEEIIIFFLICTAVAKLNIWSIIYVIYSIYLILARKTMKRYYILYCFIISSIIVQVSIFVSNLQKSTDPNPDRDIDILEKTFVLPWYEYYGMKNERAFFFGLGVCKSQIYMIWMDFIEVVIIYIYLDYFSYSIYQEGKTIGKSESSINYFNLYLNSEVREDTKKLTEEEFQKHKDCMQYNFGIQIDKEYKAFKYYIENGKSIDYKDKKVEEKKEEEKKEEQKPTGFLRRMRKKEDNQTNIANLKGKEMSGNKCINIFRKFFYLSFHNVILILIITISMMISGFISVVYIVISLYFLLTSTKIYLGEHYYYPRAIKILFRIIILVDILLQIIYQIPFVDTRTESEEGDESTFYKILGYIGLNKILLFGIDDEGYFDVLIKEEIALVIAKVLLFFFMSLQLLIYSSRNFSEYYLAYIITKKNKLRRASLMNVFKFNNKRIQVMDRAIKLRQDMAKKMEKLEKTLERWNKNIMEKKKELEAAEEIEEESEESENEENNIDNIPEAEEEEIVEKKEAPKTMIGLLALEKKQKSSDKVPKKEKEKPIIIANKSLSETVIIDNTSKLPKLEENYLTPEEVKNKIKEWILSGFLIRLQKSLHGKVANYNNISEEERDIYEFEIIKGNSKAPFLIENKIEDELRAVDLTHFTESEMKELKQYFDGTRKKRLEELKKKKKKLEKVKKTGKKVIAINKLVKKEKTEEEKEELKKEKEKIRKERREIIEKQRKERKILKKPRIDPSDPKFKGLRDISANAYIAKHLATSYIIKCIFIDILSFFSNNFEWGCYFIMILNHIMSNSLISLVYPISIFCYAIMEYPRPKKSYWTFCFIYTIVCLVIKFIIQLDILRQISGYDTNIKYLDNYFIGFKLCESTFSREFFLYILLDALVLIFLLINNYLLVFKGLYNKREQDIETIYQANERIVSNKDLTFHDPEKRKKFNNDYLTKEERKFGIEKEQIIFEKKSDENEEEENNNKNGFFKRIKKEKEQKVNTIDEKKLLNESQRTYLETLFPEARNEKPGNEYYVSYTIAMTLIILYVFLFYTIMVKDKTFGAVSMQTKQFSGEMVLFLLLHIGFLVADRIIYIRQNRTNLKYQYIFYDKVNKKIIKDLNDIDNIKHYPLFKKDDSIIPTDYVDKLKDKYVIIYIQRETFNKPLLAKYIMQMLIVIFGHIFIFFFMPMYGNYKLNANVYCTENSKECNNFLKNPSLPIFYIFYLAYFISSGLQVKYGFYDMKKKSVLKEKSNSLYGGVYAGYKAVPFLYEIKLGIDWTFTTTCLDLFQWNKFESVYDIVYTTNCAMTGINKKKVGKEVGKGSKGGMGGVLSFALLLILFGPLFLFSSLNPTNELNNLTNADLTVELCFIYKNELMKNYTIYQNSKPQYIGPISDNDLNYYNYTKCLDTKNFPEEQIQTVLFSEENDRNWDLSLPHINNLIELIQTRNKNITDSDENYVTRIDLIMDYTFYRLLPPEGQEAHKRYNSTIFTRGKNNEEDNNLGLLGNALENCSDINITIKDKYYPPIRLRASSHPKSLSKGNEEYFHNLDVQIGFVGCKATKYDNESKPIDPSYLESYFTFSTFFSTNHTEGIKFHVFSDKVSKTTQSYSPLTFYLAFVLVIGTYVRNFFAGQPEKIILTEMPHNEEIMDLCEGIKISRYSYNFEEEEKLYYILIEIMRSPDILKMLTTSSIDQFEQRKKMTEEEDKREEEEKEREKEREKEKEKEKEKGKKG